MSEIPWQDAIDLLIPYVVKISTPIGSGTGFLFAYSADQSICAVATAAHVVSHAHEWRQPIRVLHHVSRQDKLLTAEERAIVLDYDLDTAAITFSKSSIPFPEQLLSLAPEGKFLRPGVEIGWVGFPALSPENLCFFAGYISAYLLKLETYLVDGVIIHGVSGGPAFMRESTGGVTLAGVLTAYVPNRAAGEPLPGLGMVSDVSQMQVFVKKFKSLGEAKDQETPSSSAG